MQKIQYFSVFYDEVYHGSYPSDPIETIRVHVANFCSRELVEQYIADTEEDYATTPLYFEVNYLAVCESINQSELQNYQRHKDQVAALSKLSQYEKDILGIKDITKGR